MSSLSGTLPVVNIHSETSLTSLEPPVVKMSSVGPEPSATKTEISAFECGGGNTLSSS